MLEAHATTNAAFWRTAAISECLRDEGVVVRWTRLDALNETILRQGYGLAGKLVPPVMPLQKVL
jgi:hypothetical protein